MKMTSMPQMVALFNGLGHLVAVRQILHDELLTHAEGWIAESRRRIQITAGRILDAATGAELVTAEATYVAATDARKRELKERYGFGEGRPE